MVDEEILFLTMVRNNVKQESMANWLYDQIDNRIVELQKIKMTGSGDYDCWINLLNAPSNEELGRLVKKTLLSKKPLPGDFSYRQIIVGGS